MSAYEEWTTDLCRSAHDLPAVDVEQHGLAGLYPLVLLLLCANDRDLAHAEALDLADAAACAKQAQLGLVEEDALAGHGDCVHAVEHGALVAVLELCPYAALDFWYGEEGLWRGLVRSAADDGRYEAGLEEHGEDAQRLRRVRHRDEFMSCSERVLDRRAQVVREHPG